MQRIGHPKKSILSSAELKTKIDILQRHFPPSIAHLYAVPQKRGEALEWWTPLEGHPIAYKDLPSHEQQKLLQVVQQRINGIEQLANKLQSTGQEQDAQLLQDLVAMPNTEQLWSINGEPLITSWAKEAEPAVVTPPPLPAAAPVVAIKRNWWWLLLLPLLLLLLLLIYFFGSGRWSLPQPEPEVVVEDNSVPFQCRKNGVPPDFVMVIDTSGSMDLSINISEKDEKWYFSDQRTQLDNIFQAGRIAKIKSEPKRMTLAKEALTQVVEGMHPAIKPHVITFGECGTTFHKGVYDSTQRGSLMQMLQSLPADAGTPIAESMRHAARTVDGKNNDAVVLLFVDGEDNCQENVCEVASQIHQQKPRLRFNVVNISDKPMSNCIAENTGGRVYAAKDAVTLAQNLVDATNEVMNRRDCVGGIN